MTLIEEPAHPPLVLFAEPIRDTRRGEGLGRAENLANTIDEWLPSMQAAGYSMLCLPLMAADVECEDFVHCGDTVECDESMIDRPLNYHKLTMRNGGTPALDGSSGARADIRRLRSLCDRFHSRASTLPQS